MGSYKRKDGTTIVTTTVQDEAMNKRGISKLVQIIPNQPAYKTKAFASTLADYLGERFLQKIKEEEAISAKPKMRRARE